MKDPKITGMRSAAVIRTCEHDSEACWRNEMRKMIDESEVRIPYLCRFGTSVC